MKLVNMKLDPAERKDYGESVAVDAPTYPWGLTLTLDNDTLDKLGIELPAIGKSYHLMAACEVTRVSADQSADGGKTRKNRSATLQITAMQLEVHAAEGSAAEILYGEK